jgi:hypothetical protein
MSQLISLTATQRKVQGRNEWQDFSSTIGFDVDDIVSPIRRDTVLNRSYFTANPLKDSDGGSKNSVKVDYRVTDTLAVISGKSPGLINVTVTKIDGVALATSENYVFVASRISENLVPTAGGTEFMYLEDGLSRPVKYEVSNSIANIVAQTNLVSALFGANNGLSVAAGFVQLGGVLVQNTTLDFGAFNLTFDNVPAGVAGDDRLVIDATGKIKKVAASAAGFWTLGGNAGTTPGVNFIGTTDLNSFYVKTDNTTRAIFSATGQLFLGAAPNLAYPGIIVTDGYITIGGDVDPSLASNGLVLGQKSTYKWIQSFDGLNLMINPLGNLVGLGQAVATAALDLVASNISRASLRIREGVAPAAPNNGDIWLDGADFKAQVGGVTKTFTLV